MRSLFYSLCLITLFAVGVAAGDVWKKKPAAEWTEEEALEILNDSPWAKQVPLVGPLNWDYDAASTVGPGDLSKVNIGQAPSPRDDSTPRPVPGRAGFLVQWGSAMTFRQAIARLQLLRGNVTAEQAAQWLAQPSPNYEFIVSGTGVAAFAGHEEPWYQEHCQLQLKPGKENLAPLGVQLIRANGESKQLTTITLVFQRQTEAGQETIPRKTQKAELRCKDGRNEMSAGFDLRKTIVEGKPDL